jgi:hypothetical protein
MLPVISLLMIPLLYSFKKINLKIVLIFLSISIFVSILSLQFWESIDFFNVTSLYNNPNPIFNHYLPLFLKNGPRSRIFESLLFDSKIDIRNTPHSCGLTSPFIQKEEITLFSLPTIGIIALRIPFLSLLPIFLIIFVIWGREILKKINLNFKQKLFIFFVFISFFLLAFVRLRTFMYGDNWYPLEFNNGKINEDEKWISSDATVILFNKNDVKEKTNFTFEIESFNKTRILELYLNDNLIGRDDIFDKKVIFKEMELKPGENIIKFHSVSGCDRPTEIGLADCDLRCLSFRVTNVHIKSK